MKHISHGDVNLHLVNKLEGQPVAHKGSFTLALGEVTGHSHRLTVQNPDDLEIRKDAQGNMYFHLKSEGKLDHEEHGVLIVQPGTYKQIAEREFDWFALKTHQVVD